MTTRNAPIVAKAFIASAGRACPDKRFERIVFTHHHGDHIDGAPWFGAVELVGTEYCRKTVRAMAPLPRWEQRQGWAGGGEDHVRLPPTTIIDHALTYYVADVVVQLLDFAPAHTFGDLIAYLKTVR